jgi:hypothetical protein
VQRLAAFLFVLAGCASGRPTQAVAGPSADALARSIAADMGAKAWAETGAVTWRFAGGPPHLWDRRRNLDRQILGPNSTVWVDLGTHRGVAIEDGIELSGARAAQVLERAYARWANDSFWLNPLAKLFDAGVVRRLIPRLSEQPDAAGLLVEYTSGGVTPGDAYLWIVTPHRPPTRWKMWVSVLPIEGLEASWEGWTKLKTGAWISTLHRLGPASVRITELDAAAQVEALAEGVDPFAILFRH